MSSKQFYNAFFALLLYFPSLVLGVTLNPGTVGNYFTYTAPGTVDALDGNTFSIEFADGKYITITPYEVDARFLFGIDFNSSGLEPTAISGYLTDAAGNEIAGTSFTGLAISSGFGNGAITLNEVVVAHGAHITFTGVPPALPFPVRLGSGVSSNVFEDRPVIGQEETPEPGELSIDSVSVCTGPEFFEFDVSATGIGGEMVFRIGADSDPDPQIGPTERITTQINALTGEINSEAEPIAESFGAPAYDRWLDGDLDIYSIDREGDSGSSWRFSGRVRHGSEPFAAGDGLWGVTLTEDTDEVSSGSLVVAACHSTATVISVPPRSAPRLDGRIDYGEWPIAPQIELAGGSITLMHDALRLYMLINMREDDSDNALRDGGPDQFSLVFDIDEDGAISPDVDRRYRMLPGTGNFRFETYATPGGDPFNPPQEINFSALGEGFGCFLSDGSATITPLSCYTHRVWEIGMDLLEIEASADKSARLGLQVQSELDVIENLPADPTAFADFIRLHLEGRTNMDVPSRGMPTTPLSLAELRVTQGVQDIDNSRALVQSRKMYADVLVDTDEETAESVTTSLFAARDGVDLPGSPFTFSIPYNTGWGSSNRRSGPASRAVPIEGDGLGGDMAFQLIARQPLLGASLATPQHQVSFLETGTPVYWILPFNTSDNATPNLPSDDFLLRSQLEVRASFPVADVVFVQRPPIEANPATKEDAIAMLNQYDQQALLAWTLGLLITGEPPFALPDQIIGAFPANKDFGATIGLSDPRWWHGGAARVVWIKEVTADAGLLLSHELNHNLDTNIQGSWGRHVMGCGAAGLDPHWPYVNREIQEPAVITEDVMGRNGVLLRPPLRADASTPDYMSYCRAAFGSRDTAREAYPFQWVSPYRWRLQLEEVFASNVASFSFARSLASAPAAAASGVDGMLYITGQVNSDGSGSLEPIIRQPGVARADQVAGDYALRLANCDNTTLQSMSFGAAFTDVEGRPRNSTPFAMVLPDPGIVCSVQLLRGENLLAERSHSPNSPEVTVLSPSGGEQWTGTHTVRWQMTDEDGDPLSASVLYSPDGGTSWLPVAAGLGGEQYSIDSSTLPGSDQALLRVLVTDGLNTAEDDSDSTFQVARKAPTASIITPSADSEPVMAGNPLLLRGIARDTMGRELADDTFIWRLNGAPVAIGNSASVVLEPGEHQLSLQVTADNGLSSEASMALIVHADDSDGDGVPDGEDSCPESAPGALVSVASCTTTVENRILEDGCSLEELVNETLSIDGRDVLVKLLHSMRKRGELSKEESKELKRCVREDD